MHKHKHKLDPLCLNALCFSDPITKEEKDDEGYRYRYGYGCSQATLCKRKASVTGSGWFYAVQFLCHSFFYNTNIFTFQHKCLILSNIFNNLCTVRRREVSKFTSKYGTVRAQASNATIDSGGYENREEHDGQKIATNGSLDDKSSKIAKPPGQIPYLLPVAASIIGCAFIFSLIAFAEGGPSSLLAAIAKSGFTAAFMLIFVSEIGDKVLLGSMGALSLMAVLSVVIGRVFQSVPAQFQTTLPIGEYAAVTLLIFFGIKSIKDAWELPAPVDKGGDKSGPELDEFVEAEELVKEKASKRLSNPLEIIWKSFSLVFFAEWGDRSMLATIALGAAQSPWGVASGAIAGHLVATLIAIIGGALLANYISEKLVGYVGGVLFLVFAVATFFGVF